MSAPTDRTDFARARWQGRTASVLDLHDHLTEMGCYAIGIGETNAAACRLAADLITAIARDYPEALDLDNAEVHTS